MVNVGDSDFGDVAPDYTSFRRPFVVNSTIIGSTTMSPCLKLLERRINRVALRFGLSIAGTIGQLACDANL